jgi:CSLREA domain-containing protein
MNRLFARPAFKFSASMLVLSVLVTAIVGYLTAAPRPAAAMVTFTVNTILDTPDANPGDGVCADVLSNCSLRAAVMESNHSPGAHTISVPAGTYRLTLGPFDDDFNLLGAQEASGDLDILNNNLTIIGAGSASTIIDGNGIDRVIEVNSSSANGPAIDVTLQDLTIRNGNAPTASSGFRELGGGVRFDGTDNVTTHLPMGTLTINNCVITANTAASQGGGVQVQFGSLIMTGSVVSANTSLQAAGGGLAYDGGSTAGLRTLQVTNSTFSGNRAPRVTFGNGAGMSIGGNANKTVNYNVFTGNAAAARGGGAFNNNGPLTLNFNVFVGNTALAGSGSSGFRNTAGTINAQNNWWGCNQGPSLTPCDLASGPAGFGITQWLKLSHTASPNTINTNQSTTLQADFFTNNLGTAINVSDLVALNGRAVVFNNAVLGTISAADPTINGGKANATYTAGPVGGNGSADATVDSATVKATILINVPAAVTSNPTDQTACAGSSVSFSATSSGTPTPTIQWQVSSGGPFTDIPGATSNPLTFIANAGQNGNQYRAVFTNSGGTATTTAATLTVNTAPAVTTNPIDTTACDGAPVSFTAAASGSPSPTVQWQVSTGGPFANIPGAISTTLSFTATTAQNGNKYRAVFTNSCSTATTTAATLTVNANTTASGPASATVCQGATANFSTTAGGTGPFHYAWTVDGSAFDGDNSSISVPTGSLTVGSHSISVSVSGTCGSVTNNATLTVQENTSATTPADQTVCQGATAGFSTTASGTGPFHYAWKVDGISFNGDSPSISVPTGSMTVGSHSVSVVVSGTCSSVTKNASLTVQENTSASTPGDQTVCQGATAGFSTTASGTAIHYAWTVDGTSFNGDSPSISVPTGSLSVGSHPVSVTVSGTCGTVTRNATLTVQENTAATTPADQTVCQGASAGFSTTASGTAIHYAWTVDGVSFNGDSPSISVPTGSLSLGSHSVSVTVSGTCGTLTRNSTLTVQENTSATTPGDQTVCQGATAGFSTTAGGTGPFTYAWTVDGSASGGNSSSLSVPTGSLSVGSHAVSVTVSGACGSVTKNASLTVQENTTATTPADQTVCQGATANFSTTASGAGTLSYAWTLDGSAFGGNTSSISVPTGSVSVGSHAISVTVTGTCGVLTRNATLTVQENTTASTPADQTVCQSATANFSTTASGAGTLHYAWTLDGSPYNGDSSSISVPTGSLSIGSHSISVTVSGTCGNVTRNATLTVQENTSATAPANQTVCPGTNANFSTTASGQGPFHYAWTLDGSSFGGDTASISVPTGSLSSGNHSVSVSVSGACGTVNKTATLTVQQNTATTDPADQSSCLGGTASFSTTASGTGPFSFVWKKGSTVLNNGDLGGRVTIVSGPSGSTLTITNVQSGDFGTYTVATTGSCNTATQSANLTVNSTPPGIVLNGQNIELWPPNHAYHTVTVTNLVSSASSCDGTVNLNSVIIDKVTSDEVENGNGDGNTLNDIVIGCDRKSVQLRAERDGSGDGRVYTIYFKVTDGLGHSTTVTARVTVPKSQNGTSAVDSGPHYTVTGATCP